MIAIIFAAIKTPYLEVLFLCLNILLYIKHNVVSPHHTHTYMCECVYVRIYQLFYTSIIWHKVNFLNGIERVWIRSFPSLTLIAIVRLKSLVCPIIYL